MVEIDPTRAPATPSQAATVIVLREREDELEVFLVRRHSKSGFMAGAYVFPGGKLDERDHDAALIARSLAFTPADAAAALHESDEAQSFALFIAALRETFEESGVLLADCGRDEANIDEARAALQGGAPLSEIAERLDLRFRLDALVPQARWITPVVEPRRYDTRFFLATVPADQRASHDELETTASAWMSPRVALEREARGEIQLPPPTIRTLQLLSAFKTSNQALADAASRKPPLVMPVFHDVEGTWILALPGDALHPEKDSVFEGPTRFVLEQGRWWARRSE